MPVQWCWKGPPALPLSVQTLLLLPPKGGPTLDTEFHTPGLVRACGTSVGGWVSLLSLSSSLVQVSSQGSQGLYLLWKQRWAVCPSSLEKPCAWVVLLT